MPIRTLRVLLFTVAATASAGTLPTLPYKSARFIEQLQVQSGSLVLYPACDPKTESPYIAFDPIVPPIRFKGDQAVLPFVHTRIWPEVRHNNGWIVHIEASGEDGQPVPEEVIRNLETQAYLYCVSREELERKRPRYGTAGSAEGSVTRPPESPPGGRPG